MTQTVQGVIAREKGAPVEVVDIVIPEPGPNDVVVKVQATGVCHTDLAYRDGDIADEFPFLLGHEAAGVIEAVGEGVTEVAPGDFVILNWRAVCGQCRACAKGKPWYCFATHNASKKMTLSDGTASLGCELDYANAGDGTVLTEFDRDALREAMSTCAERGVFRLRFRGRVTQEFTQLMQRLAVVADELAINKRVLDIDSSGGMVEEALRAGDVIAESRWTIWVRDGAVCHSSCVFVLAGGDTRLIGGRVGIHRIIRMSSTATTRVELNAELRAVYDRVRSYLERNGAAVAVADAMMAVPNRSLRLLTGDELRLFGLDGVNPAQDDLDRLADALEQGILLSETEQAEAFGPDWDPQWTREARDRWGGTDAWTEQAERGARRGPEQWARLAAAPCPAGPDVPDGSILPGPLRPPGQGSGRLARAGDRCPSPIAGHRPGDRGLGVTVTGPNVVGRRC